MDKDTPAVNTRRSVRAATRRLPAVGAVLAVAALSGCGGANATKAGSQPVHASQASFAPANFGAPATGANKWLPLNPGTQWVRDGATDVGHRRVHHQVISTVTDVSRQVDGVKTVAVLDQDIDAGQIAQQSIDYMGQDKQGNVWDLGSYTEEYEGGRFTTQQDAWLGGVKGGKAGILMQAHPRAGTPPYSIAQPPGADPDVAEVLDTGHRTCVPLRCFKGVLLVREGKASAPDNEFKYYAAGVGQILNTPRKDSKHHDYEQLVNLRRLSGKGLAELSNVALKLDRHAAVTAPTVFGHGPAARRGF